MSRLARWAVLFLSIGCASSPVVVTPSPVTTATPSSAPASVPTTFAPHELVLRMTIYEPIPPPVALDTDVPEFSMYGDGRVIYQERLPRDAHRVSFRQAQTTEEQFDALLGLAAQSLAGTRPSYPWPSETEAQSTWFQIRLGTGPREVSVWALERQSGMDGSIPPDAEVRQQLRNLRVTLEAFGAGVVPGSSADLGAFESEVYLATITQARPEMPVEPDPEWPWPGLPPELFGRAPDGTLTAQVARADAEQVLAHGSDGYFAAIAPDGAPYLIELRPLLPDEVR